MKEGERVRGGIGGVSLFCDAADVGNCCWCPLPTVASCS